MGIQLSKMHICKHTAANISRDQILRGDCCYDGIDEVLLTASLNTVGISFVFLSNVVVIVHECRVVIHKRGGVAVLLSLYILRSGTNSPSLLASV